MTTRRRRKKKLTEFDKDMRRLRGQIRVAKWVSGKVRRPFAFTFDESTAIVAELGYSVLMGLAPAPYVETYMAIIRRLSPLNADSVQRTLDARKAEAEKVGA